MQCVVHSLFLRAVFFVCTLTSAPQDAGAQTCQDIARGVRTLDLSLGKEVPIEPNSQVTFRAAFKECDDKNTFNGKPLPSKRKCSNDKNRVERLLVLPDHTLVVTAKASVDADGSLLSRTHAGTSDPETSFKLKEVSLDAEFMPYVVMPGSLNGPHLNVETNINTGDLAVVIKGDHCSFAIVGDMGPYFRFGEISMAAHEDLGNPQCLHAETPCTVLKGKGGDGVTIPGGVTYVFFPGTKPDGLTAANFRDQVKQRGKERIRKFLTDYAVPK